MILDSLSEVLRVNNPDAKRWKGVGLFLTINGFQDPGANPRKILMFVFPLTQ